MSKLMLSSKRDNNSDSTTTTTSSPPFPPSKFAYASSTPIKSFFGRCVGNFSYKRATMSRGMVNFDCKSTCCILLKTGGGSGGVGKNGLVVKIVRISSLKHSKSVL